MDYGKYRFEQLKTKKKPKQIHVKEIKIRPTTDEGDYQVKLRNLIRFLKEGNKAKITVRFRGRELVHQELGMKLLERMQLDLAEYAVIEQMPRLEGRQLVMLIGPKKKS